MSCADGTGTLELPIVCHSQMWRNSLSFSIILPILILMYSLYLFSIVYLIWPSVMRYLTHIPAHYAGMPTCISVMRPHYLSLPGCMEL